ncbi:MAG: hypothetical protein ACKPEA_13175 [Planctomycetota bacterium]
MVRSAVPAIVAFAFASASFAGVTSMQGTGIVADGAYAASGLLPNAWSITFDFDGDLNASSTIGEFGAWSFSLSNGAQRWSASGDGSVGGRWTTNQGARIFTIDLADAGSTGAGSTLAPAPTSVSIVYSAVRVGGVWSTLGQALQRSQTATFDALRGGFIVRTGTIGGPDLGTITSGYAVPAPGAAALVAAAGLLARRRRPRA